MSKQWEPRPRKYRESPKFPYDRYPKKKRKVSKFFIQTVSTILIFLSIWVAFSMEGPMWYKTQAAMRDWFVKDTDIKAVFNVVKQIGFKGDTFERAGFEVINPANNNANEPMAIPVSGTVTVPFGWGKDSGKSNFHNGIVINAPISTAVKAAYSGTVLEIKDDEKLGRTLILSHKNGLMTVYGYCSEILVKENEVIEKGQIIAKTGKGKSTPEGQLYFEANRLGEPVNPMDLLEIDKGI
ncbi:Peptidase family M23 [Desulfonispora thiosulfatigenes DSM 11270]|uniref:Peptidase family M23 n=1 Tax=Desulfonispora thiosulfatigenes DSM 11270 TaxID=656914 RepID=A0A1W1UHC5_DESTI|nr:M23 family metallopeptidase [Desulfonispora thiosulfatigenes]SMB80432.1 Peptidase family M23 [Desulfonispora thiosulfatigenes DSM 11270]